MIKEYRDKFPSWCNSNKIFYMCLTDDLDSLFSCILLNKIKNYEVTHFYSFNTLYQNEAYTKGKYKLIGVDMGLVKNKYRAWDNHVIYADNCNNANVNTIEGISTYTYTSKYAGSTLLEIISFYDYDISNLSEEAKMILLCIDSTYFMYNFNKPNCKKWLVDVLELEELYQLLETHTREEFDALQSKYKLKKKIFVNQEGELKTSIDLESLSELFNLPFLLPQNTFKPICTYTEDTVETWQYYRYKEKLEKQNKKIFSQAMTKRGFLKLSYN